MRSIRLVSCIPFVILAAFVLNSSPARTQTTAANEWAWIGGSSDSLSNLKGPSGLYGSLGIPAAATPATSVATLSVSATSLTSGEPLTLTATVTAGGVAVTPGQVNFCDASVSYCTDIHLLGTRQLTGSGSATLKFYPSAGAHSYKAVFLGTNSAAGNSSNIVPVIVGGTGSLATSTTLVPGGSAGNYTLTATVIGQGAIPPTGSVSFLDTGNANYLLGTAQLTPGSFVTASLYTTNVGEAPSPGPFPQSVALGDFNGDGKLDLVVPNASSDLTILLGNGDGTFYAAPSVPVAGNTVLRAVVADFNGDGNADIAILLDNTNLIQVLLGNGDGTFTPLTPIPGVASAAGIFATGDFNGDGKPDLVIANGSTKSLTILLGNGDGSFTPASEHPATGNYPTSIVVGDFNNDGKADLAVTTIANSVKVLLGNGDGSFTPAAESAPTGNEPVSITAGDFSGNGILDLAVVNSVDKNITILMGKGNGEFTPASTSPITGATAADYIAIGDFDGDGKTDLLTVNPEEDTATILLGNGDGTFPAIWFAGTSIDPIYAAVGDFNGDGLSDIAIANNNPSAMTILLSQPYDLATSTASVTGISLVGSGTHLVDASYSGDGYFSGSVSASIPLTAEPVPTTLTLSANPTSSVFGQQVLLTAALSPSIAQDHHAGGTVTFYNGVTKLGTGSVLNGVSSLKTSMLPAGSDSLVSVYSGDTNFAASNSNPLPYAVSIFTTTTTLSALPTTLSAGQTLTLKATVTPNSGATPAGTVTFLNGSSSLGSAPVGSNGAAELQLTPAVGSYSITASYGGSATDSPSASKPPASFTVNLIATTTKLDSLPPTLTFGMPLTLTAAVTPASGGAATGTVTFFNGTISLGSASLTGSMATLTFTPAFENYIVTARYSGSAEDAASASLPSEVKLLAVSLATSLTALPNPAPFGAEVTLTATVGTGSPQAIGSVSFYDGALLLGSGNLASGVATYSTSMLSAGSHSLIAQYTGGPGFNPSTSTVVSEVITAADFGVSAAPASQTVYTGEAATYSVSLTPGTGFNLPVTLRCTLLPANTACIFSMATLPAGGKAADLIVQTSAPTQASKLSGVSGKLRAAALAGLLLLFIPQRLRRRRGWPALLLMVAMPMIGIAGAGCSTPGPLIGGTPVGAQTVIISASATNGSQTLTHTTTVTLNVKSLF